MSEDINSDSELEDDFEKDLDELDEDEDEDIWHTTWGAE